MNAYSTRLALLREIMVRNKIDVYIIPSGDPHLGEYIPDHWKIIPWLTGFTGSNATVVVTDTFAGLWTDSRYFVQADNQLRDSGFRFVKPDSSGKNDFTLWLSENTSNGSKIGFDGRIISVSRKRRIESSVSGKSVSLLTDSDLVSELWKDRPPMSDSKAIEFPVIYAGKESSVKIGEVREKMRKMQIDYHLLTSLDDIMWLLNIK